GQQDVVVAGGVEGMSRGPLGSARATGMPYCPKVLARYGDFSFNQGISAELIAQKWGFSRTRLDEYSARSHELAATAQDDGAFETQIMPVFTDAEPVVADEGIRRGTTVEKLAGLKPAFKEDGVIHAGNSSQISDGAAALLVMTAENAVAMGLTPMVRYRAGAVTGADPVLMLTGPIPATEKVLHKAGVGLDEVGVFEVNEAFAPVPLAWLAETGADQEKLNPLGGAIALGHPLGASGAVLMTRMINHMRDNGIRYGLQTMCEGGGTANATLVELISELRRVMRRDLFTSDHEAFRELARDFVEKEVVPHYPEWEKGGRMPRDVFKQMGALGMLGMAIPEEYGGAGMPDYRYNVVMQEEGARALVTLSTVRTQLEVILPYFLHYANAEQRERWFPGLASGTLLTAIAMTEPGTGSDLAGMRT